MGKYKILINNLIHSTEEKGIKATLTEVFQLPKMSCAYAVRSEVETSRYQDDLEDFDEQQAILGICNYIIASRGELRGLTDTTNFSTAVESMTAGSALASVENMSLTVTALQDKATRPTVFTMIYTDEKGNLQMGTKAKGVQELLSGNIAVDSKTDIHKYIWVCSQLMSKFPMYSDYWRRIFDIARGLQIANNSRPPFILECLPNEMLTGVIPDYEKRVSYKKKTSTKVTPAGKVTVIRIMGEV